MPFSEPPRLSAACRSCDSRPGEPGDELGNGSDAPVASGSIAGESECGGTLFIPRNPGVWGCMQAAGAPTGSAYNHVGDALQDHSSSRNTRTLGMFLAAALPLLMVLALMVFRPTWWSLSQ